MKIEIFNNCYLLTQDGEVYSLINNAGNRRNTPYLLKTPIGRGNYKQVKLFVPTPEGKKYICITVHRLVATHFLPNPESKPEVNHINGNKLDNRLCNLEWVTKSENAIHAYKLGLRSPNLSALGRMNEKHSGSVPINKLTLDGVFIQRYPSMAQAKREGYSQGNISSVLNGTRKTHKGYKWEIAK
jgi:hypothetical protein